MKNYILNLKTHQTFAAEKHGNGFNYNTFRCLKFFSKICILNFTDEQSERRENETRDKGLCSSESKFDCLIRPNPGAWIPMWGVGMWQCLK